MKEGKCKKNCEKNEINSQNTLMHNQASRGKVVLLLLQAVGSRADTSLWAVGPHPQVMQSRTMQVGCNYFLSGVQLLSQP